MDPSIAKSLISTLYKEPLAHEKLAPILTLKVCDLFVPSLFGTHLVLKKTLHGRLSQIFNYTSETKDFQKKIRHVFAISLKTLSDQKDLASTPREAFWRMRLYEELKKDEVFTNSLPKQYGFTTDHFDDLHDTYLKNIEAKKAAYQQKLFPSSFLRAAVPSPISKSLLNEIFEENDDFSMEMLEYISCYLDANPEDTSSNYKFKLNALYHAKLERDTLDELYFSNNTVISSELIQEEATAFVKKINHLKCGESTFYLGSYGKNDINLKELFSLIKLLPESIFLEIPKNIRECLKLEDPVEFVKNLAREGVENGLEEATNLFGKEHLEFIRSLVDGSKIPEKLKEVIAFVTNESTPLKRELLKHLSPLLKFSQSSQILDILALIFENRDLLKSDEADKFCHFISILFKCLSFVPSEKSIEFIVQIQENAHLITDSSARDQLQKKIEDRIDEHLQGNKEIIKPVEKTVRKAFREIQKMLPVSLQEHFHIDDIFSGGSFFVEFTKEKDDSFTVYIYTSLQIMEEHKKTRSGENIQWPIKISGVSKNLIDKSFIHLLLRHHVEPKIDEQSVLKGKDLLKSVTEYLGGHIEENNDCNTRQISDQQNSADLVLNLLSKKDVPLGFPLFKMRFAALVNFCGSLMSERNQSLKIKSEEDVAFLENSTNQLKKDILQFSKFFNSNFMDRFQSTIEEVKNAVEDFRFNGTSATDVLEDEAIKNPLNLPPLLIKVLRSTLHQLKIDEQFIKSHRETLCWVLEQDFDSETSIGFFVDALAESVGQISENKQIIDPKEVEQVSGLSKNSLHQLLSDVYFQAALSALKIALKAARVYTQGVSPFFMLSLLTSGLNFILPSAILKWYNNVISLLLRQFIQTTLYIIFNLLLSKDDLDKMNALKNHARSFVTDLTKRIISGNVLSLDAVQAAARPLITELNPKLETLSLSPVPSPIINKELELFAQHRLFYKSDELVFERKVFEPSKILDYLKQVKSDLIANNGCVLLLRDLPIPEKNGSSFWDSVQNVSECIQELHFVCEELGNLEYHDEKKLGESAVTHYQLLAILDYLVRKENKSRLNGYQINVYGFVTFVESECAYLECPLLLENVKKILKYFDLNYDALPTNGELRALASNSLFFEPYVPTEFKAHSEILIGDVEQNYLLQFLDDAEFEQTFSEFYFTEEIFSGMLSHKLKADLLWDHFTEELLRRSRFIRDALKKDFGITDSRTASIKKGILNSFEKLIVKLDEYEEYGSYVRVDIIEFELHLERSEKPHLMDYITQKSQKNLFSYDIDLRGYLKYVLLHENFLNRDPIVLETIQSLYIPNNYRKVYKLKILSEESFIPSNKPLLPSGYLILKNHALKSSWFMKEGGHHKRILSTAPSPLYFRERGDLSDEKALLNRPTGVLRNMNFGVKFHYPVLPKIIENYFDNINPFVIDSRLNILVKPKSQSAIIAEIKNDGVGQEQFNMILCERQDAIMRLLGFFKNNINYLNETNDPYKLFQAVLFRLGDLERQIKNSPQSIRAMGEFFRELLEDQKTKQKFKNCFWLIKIGLKLKAICKYYKSEHLDAFPDFIQLEADLELDYALLGTKQELDEFKIREDNQRLFERTKHFLSEQLQKVLINGNQLGTSLYGLTTFCPLSDIECITDRKSRDITQINLAKLLHFEVSKVNGALKAFSKEFPGFHIAPKQFDPELNGIGNYLILQNENGLKKVILRGGCRQTVATALIRFLPSIGVLAPFVIQALDQFNLTSSGYHSFNLEKNGLLTSENPDALSFLIVLYLLKNKRQALTKTFESFKIIAKREPIPGSVLGNFIPLMLLPIDTCGSYVLRRSLIAVLEENLAIFEQAKDQEKSLIFSELITVIATIYDLNIKDRPKNEYEDWFLFKSAIRRMDKLISDNFSHAEHLELLKKLIYFLISSFTGNPEFYQYYIDKIGELTHNKIRELSLGEALLTVIVNPETVTYYTELRRKFGGDISLFFRGMKIVSKALMKNNNLSLPSNLDLSGVNFNEILPSLDQKNGDGFVAMASGIYCKEGKSKLEILDIEYMRRKMMVNTKLISTETGKDEKYFVLEPQSLDPLKMTEEILIKHFLSFYHIAREPKDKKEYQDFKKLILFIRGGFDNRTKILVEYLETVFKNPSIFKKLNGFLNRSMDLNMGVFDKILFKIGSTFFNQDTSSPALEFLLEEFFEETNERTVQIMQGALVSSTLLRTFLNIPAKNALFMNLGLNPSPIVSPIYNIQKVLSLCETAKDEAVDLFSDFVSSHLLPKRTEHLVTNEVSSSMYEPLNDEDAGFDWMLDSFFNIAFEACGKKRKEQSVSPIENKGKNAAAFGTIDRVNQSIKDFYNRDDDLVQFKLKQEALLWNLYVALSDAKKELTNVLKKERQMLLALVGSDEEGINFAELKSFFLTGDFKKIGRKKGFNLSELQKLEFGIAKHIVRLTRLQQIKRVIAHLEDLSQMDLENKNPYEDKLEQIADELLARRVYSFTDSNLRLVRRLMLFELMTNKLIWKKQFECTKLLLSGKDSNSVLEVLMSLGKTYFVIPTVSSFEANGKQIVFNVFPQSIAATNIRQISHQAKDIFNQTANVFKFSRASKLNQHNLDAIFVVLNRALEKRETINLTKEDAQSLELIFVDQMAKIFQSGRSISSVESASLLKLQMILQVIRTSGKVIGDEAHELFNRKLELNFPLGKTHRIKESYYFVMEACMRNLIRIPDILNLLKKNELSSVKDYEYQVLRPLAKQMSRYKRFDLSRHQAKEFVEYVSGKSDTIPAWIFASEHFSEIALVKGVLTVLLPLVFEKTVNVDFGASLEGNGEYSRPYFGNSAPNEKALIAGPYETFIKTFTQFLHTGLDDKQYEKLMKALKAKADQEIKNRQVPYEKTLSFKVLNKWKRGLSENTSSDELIHHIKDHPDAILLYTRFRVQSEILYWKKIIRSGPQDFPSMFASGFFDTGTPYNFGTYPSNMKMQFDPGTIGEALHIISKKCPKDGLHTLDKKNPLEILKEVLVRFFQKGSDFTAIIDGGSLLKGIANKQVADEIIEYVKRDRSDIQEIVYFENEGGRDRLIAKSVKTGNSVPLDQSKVLPENRLSYFDDVHCFATNIPQKSNAKGLDLVGPKLTLQRLMQEVFRMRGLKTWKKLVSGSNDSVDGDEKDTTQTIQFAMTKSTKELIFGTNNEPDLKKLILFAIENEARLSESDNFQSYQDKVTSLIRRAVFDKILGMKSLTEMMEMFHEFESVLINTIEDDPAKLFGPILKEMNVLGEDGVLKQMRVKAFKPIKKSLKFDASEKSVIFNALEAIKIEAMPEKIMVSLDDSSSGISKEVTNEIDNECENENENETQNQCQIQKSTNAIFHEWPWKGNFNPHLTDWMNFSKLSLSSFEQLNRNADFLKTTVVPPLFRLNDLLMASKDEELKAIASFFDKRIYATNNFVPTYVPMLEASVSVGSLYQRELFELLVHFSEQKDGIQIEAVGCLSEKDAKALREQFDKSKTGKQKTNAFIYDTVNRTIVAGHEVDLNLLRKNPDMQKLVALCRFLNGDLNYQEDHLRGLKSWVSQSDISKIKRAFLHIHKERNTKSIIGTDIDYLLKEATFIPKFESI